MFSQRMRKWKFAQAREQFCPADRPEPVLTRTRGLAVARYVTGDCDESPAGTSRRELGERSKVALDLALAVAGVQLALHHKREVVAPVEPEIDAAILAAQDLLW